VWVCQVKFVVIVFYSCHCSSSLQFDASLALEERLKRVTREKDKKDERKKGRKKERNKERKEERVCIQMKKKKNE
jgi:hypothetical protein